MRRRMAVGNGNAGFIGGDVASFCSSTALKSVLVFAIISWAAMFAFKMDKKYAEPPFPAPAPAGYDHDFYERCIAEIETATAAKIETEIARLGEELKKSLMSFLQRPDHKASIIVTPETGMPTKCSVKDDESKSDETGKPTKCSTKYNESDKFMLDEVVREYARKVVDEAIEKQNVKLDEVRAFAQEVVKEAMEKHAADGIGRADYAMGNFYSILKHSEAFQKIDEWTDMVHPHADKMVRPSFGERGDCFGLKGTSGFAHIKLQRLIIPEAVTLEHVAKSVALDKSRGTAPKDCKVFGWLSSPGQEPANMLLLAEFTYDLEGSPVQTFNVSEGYANGGAGVINTIKFEFTSNHGNPHYTCIYRVRVHGHDPNLRPIAKE